MFMCLSRLAFEAYDLHSGLKTIHWQLYDKANDTILHGQDNLAVRSPTVSLCIISILIFITAMHNVHNCNLIYVSTS